jgi:branched-chain amino acid transport system substrate-binding protein
MFGRLPRQLCFRPVSSRWQRRPLALPFAIAVALTLSACTDGGPFGAPDEPDVLRIAVDLPFQGGARDVSDDTWNAMSLYLEQVNFTAGRHTVELTKRDNSTSAKGTWNEASCAQNARAHVADGRQVAVVGTYNSGCTKVELPVLNQAEGGPMLMVSHANTSTGLTGPGEPGEPERYAPTGLPAFARVIPAEAIQGAAAAQFAADELDVTRCYVLDDGDRYGLSMARAFADEAVRRGVQVVGSESWNRADANYVALFGRIRVKNPDCVFLGGLYESNGGRLVTDKVAVLGDNDAVTLLAPDGFVGYPDFAALPGASGAFLTFPGLSTQDLKSQGSTASRFLADFERKFGYEPRGEYAAYALYGVQALQVVLAAIERSDGTRKGVRDAVFAGAGVTVPAETAMLGREVTIDPGTGDVSLRDVSIRRVADGEAVPVRAWAVG